MLPRGDAPHCWNDEPDHTAGPRALIRRSGRGSGCPTQGGGDALATRRGTEIADTGLPTGPPRACSLPTATDPHDGRIRRAEHGKPGLAPSRERLVLPSWASAAGGRGSADWSSSPSAAIPAPRPRRESRTRIGLCPSWQSTSSAHRPHRTTVPRIPERPTSSALARPSTTRPRSAPRACDLCQYTVFQLLTVDFSEWCARWARLHHPSTLSRVLCYTAPCVGRRLFDISDIPF